jgi:hypothetical protein
VVQAVVPAAVTAAASILVAAAVFVGNIVVQARNERRQTVLARVDAQIHDLYGPLFALMTVNERLWTTMRATMLPDSGRRHSDVLTQRESEEWRSWLQQVLMPTNIKMRDAIMRHADLMIGDNMPTVLQDFCAHVASYEVVLARGDGPDEPVGRPLVPHPGTPFAEYVRTSFAALKSRQATLLESRRDPVN